MTEATYDYWHRALAINGGSRPLTREEMQSLGVTHEPGCGFFAKRMHKTRLIKDDEYTPVAIWIQDGALVAIDGPDPTDAEEVWPHALRFPITEESYRQMAGELEGVTA